LSKILTVNYDAFMKDDYKFLEESVPLNIKLEKSVSEILTLMTTHTGIPANEIINTSLKRFIATHKDFLPSEID